MKKTKVFAYKVLGTINLGKVQGNYHLQMPPVAAIRSQYNVKKNRTKPQ